MQIAMSAMGQKRTSLFDDLVGASNERWRNRHTDRFGSLEINDKFECRGLFDWNFVRFFAIDDLLGVVGKPPEEFG